MSGEARQTPRILKSNNPRGHVNHNVPDFLSGGYLMHDSLPAEKAYRILEAGPVIRACCKNHLSEKHSRH